MQTSLFSSLMDLLRSFSALAMVSSVILTLLPEGTMRKTVSMAAALMMMLLWINGLSEKLLPEDVPSLSRSILTGTGLSLEEAASSALEHLHLSGGEVQ